MLKHGRSLPTKARIPGFPFAEIQEAISVYSLGDSFDVISQCVIVAGGEKKFMGLRIYTYFEVIKWVNLPCKVTM